MERLLKAIAPSIFAFLIYIVYTGGIRLYDIATGVVVSIIVGIATAPLLVEDWRKSLSISRFVTLIKYVFRYFLIDEVKAHWTVIKMGLSPNVRIRPGIVRVPINSRSEYAITLVAISITNTPGTVTVDVDREKGVLYVNWIYVKSERPEDTYREIASVFDRYAKKIFD
uniref:Cation:proton antiporter n=1 Tax=Ignisphaera aggregans TaxID=334771 RepID=A0A7C2ZNT7_9CREN